MVLSTKKLYILSGLLFFSFPLRSLAMEDLGYFDNDILQNKLNKSYTLTHEKKSFPLPIDQYVTVESTLIEKYGYASEIENPYYCREKTKNLSLCDVASPLTNRTAFKKSGRFFLDKEKFISRLKELSAQIDRQPENGRLKVGEDGKAVVYAQSKDGYELNVEKTYESLKGKLLSTSQEVALPLTVDIKKPEIFTDNIENYGIKELVAHGESNFRGSPANRIHNIQTALKQFEGILLKPGEEFSFTKLLGEVDGEHGYKEELVIKDNETIPEFGGGICQVSTTVFRAALNGGLKITERHNHAYPVQYYAPHGTDATIYVPKPDLRFINDTPAYILVQTKIEGTKLSFNFFGTSDGRTTELEGPVVTERTADGKLKTSLKQIVKGSGGNIIREDIFKSFYDNPAKYHHEPLITKKPDNWSKKQWKDYQQSHKPPSN